MGIQTEVEKGNIRGGENWRGGAQLEREGRKDGEGNFFVQEVLQSNP